MHRKQRSGSPARAAIGIAAALGAAVLLAGCAATPAEAPTGSSSAPSAPVPAAPGASDQTVSEACDVSRQRVEATFATLSERITEAQSTAAAGSFPDLAGIALEVGNGLTEATSLVTNETVLEAVNNVGTEVAAFGQMPTPSSLIEVPGYVDSLLKQWQRTQDAHQRLLSICG